MAKNRNTLIVAELSGWLNAPNRAQRGGGVRLQGVLKICIISMNIGSQPAQMKICIKRNDNRLFNKCGFFHTVLVLYDTRNTLSN